MKDPGTAPPECHGCSDVQCNGLLRGMSQISQTSAFVERQIETDGLLKESQLKRMQQDLNLNLALTQGSWEERGWVILSFRVSVSLLAKHSPSCDSWEGWCQLTKNNLPHEVWNQESLASVLISHLLKSTAFEVLWWYVNLGSVVYYMTLVVL